MGGTEPRSVPDPLMRNNRKESEYKEKVPKEHVLLGKSRVMLTNEEVNKMFIETVDGIW